MRTPHTSFHKGTSVFIILRDGEKIEDKFLDHKSGCVILRRSGKIDVKKIRSMSIRKLTKMKEDNENNH